MVSGITKKVDDPVLLYYFHCSKRVNSKNVAAKGPALANGTLLVAEGCSRRYLAVLKALFTAYRLPCPDMDTMFDLQLPESTHIPQPTHLAKQLSVNTHRTIMEDIAEHTLH